LLLLLLLLLLLVFVVVVVVVCVLWVRLCCCRWGLGWVAGMLWALLLVCVCHESRQEQYIRARS